MGTDDVEIHNRHSKKNQEEKREMIPRFQILRPEPSAALDPVSGGFLKRDKAKILEAWK